MRRRARKASASAVTVQEQLDRLLTAVSAAHPAADIRGIRHAYEVAAYAHHNQTRKSGDPYISHPIEVAMIVTELGMSPEVVCAALLHDIVEQDATHPYTLARLHEEFGEEIAELVDGTAKLDRSGNADEKLRSLEAAVGPNADRASLLRSREVAVLVLKLADRLHNMRTLRHLSSSKQQLKSRQTLRVYVPLARLLGMKTVERELEDLASATLFSRFDDNHPHTVSERALVAAVVLLPPASRVRWVHEWAGELSVLPTRRARARFAL